jgi:hypothetical protein
MASTITALGHHRLTDSDATKLLREWLAEWEKQDQPPTSVSIKTAIFLILNDHDDIDHEPSEIIPV